MKYKKLKYPIYFVLAITMILPVSCLKDDNEAEEKENQIIKTYVTNNAGFVANTSGMYYKQLSEGTGTSPKATDMVIISYKAWKLETLGLFDTSDQSEATLYSLTGKTLLSTEGPLKIAVSGSYGFYAIGVSQALLTMKEGGSAYIIVPGSLGLGNNTPLLFQVNLLKVISNPQQFERDQISKYLTDNTNLTLADSIGAHSSTSSDSTGLWIFNKTEGTGNLPVIGDSVYITYSLKFIPYSEDPYLDVPERTIVSNASIRIKLNYTNLIEGFTGAVRLIKDQGRATVIIPNHKAYGAAIAYTPSTGQVAIPQYSTLIYDMQITKVKKNN
jgi:FKBP-type peptidyl-prolyl cis-trans isomerase